MPRPGNTDEIDDFLDSLASEEQTSIEISVSATKKRKRGPSRGILVDREAHDLGRIKVEIPIKCKRPICKNACKLTNEIGICTRYGFPLTCANWKSVPMEIKQTVIERVLMKFDLDITQERMMNFLYDEMKTTFKEFRSTLWEYYKTFSSPIEARAKKHHQVSKESEWNVLCDRWASDSWKKKSETNSKNRAKLKFNHKSGSRSFDRLCHEKIKNDGIELDQIEKFRLTRSNDNGWVNKEAESKYKEMIDLKEKPVEEGAQPLTVQEIYDKILNYHPKSKSRKLTSSNSCDNQQANEAELEKLRVEVASMKDTMKRFEEFIMQSQGGGLNVGGVSN